MDHWRLMFVLLLSMFLCFETEVIVKKTIWRGPDITDKEPEASHWMVYEGEPDLMPICSNESLDIIIEVTCNISTSWRKECILLYELGRDIADECGPSFRLVKKNPTISLQMMSLTPEDGRIYTCECTRSDGTYVLHFNVSVEESAEPISIPLQSYSWIIIIILIAVVILGIFLYKIYGRFNSTRSGTSGQHESGSKHPPGKCDEPDNVYEDLKEPTKDNYETIDRQHRSEMYVNGQSSQGNMRM